VARVKMVRVEFHLFELVPHHSSHARLDGSRPQADECQTSGQPGFRLPQRQHAVPCPQSCRSLPRAYMRSI